MNNSLKKIYEFHHEKEREDDFSVLKKERGVLFSKLIGKGKKVLDLGCRDGALTVYFTEGNEILGVDIDETSLRKFSKKLRVETLLMDLNGSWSKLRSKTFDVVVMAEVLEHLYYPRRVLRKVKNVQKEKGIFIGSIPNAFSLKNRMRYLIGRKKHTPLNDPTHINHFGYGELKKILEKHFKEVKIIGLGKFKKMAKIFPTFFAYDLVFLAKNENTHINSKSRHQ